MQPLIFIPARADYPRIMEVWEASVRATHHFLDEEYIIYIKELLFHKILDALELYCVSQQGLITGIMGLSDDKVEMLFIHPDARGTGIGKRLLTYAIEQRAIKKVDVNEQNVQAVGFYMHMGFSITGRSETDALGKPYPILAMELQG